MSSTSDYKVGDKVVFGRPNGEQTEGTVVKVNRAKLKVRQDETRGTARIRPAGTIWTVPPSLCRKVGSGAPVGTPLSTPPAPKVKRPEAEVMADILSVYCSLSPENLSCDGELSMSRIRSRAASLRADLRRLFAELGREVTESEAYGDKPYAGERTPISRSTYAPAKSSGWKIGDKVAFDAKGRTVVGFVKRVNQKTVSVQPLGGGTRYWRVSPRLLKAA